MKTLNLPPLNALKAFDAAARHGGFRAAAEHLNVTHSVIGRHIRGLEERLGVKLFEQANRGVKLTRAGAAYAEQISDALVSISDATTNLTQQHGKNRIRILVVPGFGTKWLSPRLRDLTRTFRQLTIVVEPATDFSDALDGKADFGITFGYRDEVPDHAEHLVELDVFPVCSPTYYSEHGPFSKPADLLQADLLNEDFGEWWADWFTEHDLDSPSHTRLVFSTSTQAIDAAAEHQGIALANKFLVANDLETGRLMRLDLPSFEGGAYWMIRKDGSTREKHVEAVATWIKTQMQEYDTQPAARS